tara:strand:- start:3 stop:632 length:630 start_codon:yes stop_codon:yes gene_type:complete
MTVAGSETTALVPFTDLLLDEVNIKTVEFTDELKEYATFVLQPKGAALGPRLGKEVQNVFLAAKNGEWTLNDDGTIDIASHNLAPNEFDLSLEPVEGIAAASLESGNAVVILNTTVTKDLQQEGIARDVVRHIQQARRDADFIVTDRIQLWLDANEQVLDSIREHEDWISGQVLATNIYYGPEIKEETTAPLQVINIEGAKVTFALLLV